LILLDCCSAASSISGDGSGVTEVIAACGFETWAPGVGEHSFTRSLIDELKYRSGDHTLSVATLHQKVLSRIKYWNPRYGTTGEHEHRKTPIYIVLSNEGKRRSIELSPLRIMNRPPAELAATVTHGLSSDSSSASSEASSNGDEFTLESSQSSLDQDWNDPSPQAPKAIISIALEEDQWLQTNEWLDWLRSIPALVTYARVEGVFKSGSTLVLLSVPIAVWDLLPRSPAISFITFVASRNLLLDTPSTQATCVSSALCSSDEDRSERLQLQQESCEKTHKEYVLALQAELVEAETVNREMMAMLAQDYQNAPDYMKGVKDMREKMIKYAQGNHDRLQCSEPGCSKTFSRWEHKFAHQTGSHGLRAQLKETLPPVSSNSSPEAAMSNHTNSRRSAKAKNFAISILAKYITVFVIDDSAYMQEAWPDTIGLLERCLSLDVFKDTGGYSIDFANGEKGVKNVGDFDSLRAIVPSGPNFIYQLLCAHLDNYHDTLLSLGPNERQSHPGLNLIILTGSPPSRPLAAFKELFQETAVNLDRLDVAENKVGVHFVRIGCQEPANAFFDGIGVELIAAKPIGVRNVSDRMLCRL